LVQFLLHKLKSVEDSLLDQPFRLKSYSSTINKLFYRGKPSTDLLAATVETDVELKQLKKELSQRGAMRLDEENMLNVNNDPTYRYARILQLTFDGSPTQTVPIYYEVVVTNFNTHASHKEYELGCMKYGLSKGQQNTWKIVASKLRKFALPRSDGSNTSPRRRLKTWLK
jgi:hypothetical protein